MSSKVQFIVGVKGVLMRQKKNFRENDHIYNV